MPIVIRGADPDDGPILREIERLSGARFREVGLDHIADDEPASVETLSAYERAGRSWVALDAQDYPIGPLYAHLGFVALSEDEIGPELRAIRQEEAKHGLDPEAGRCMRLELELSGRTGS